METAAELIHQESLWKWVAGLQVVFVTIVYRSQNLANQLLCYPLGREVKLLCYPARDMHMHARSASRREIEIGILAVELILLEVHEKRRATGASFLCKRVQKLILFAQD